MGDEISDYRICDFLLKSFKNPRHVQTNGSGPTVEPKMDVMKLDGRMRKLDEPSHRSF